MKLIFILFFYFSYFSVIYGEVATPTPTVELEEVIIRAEPEGLLAPGQQVIPKAKIEHTSVDLFDDISEVLKTFPGVITVGDFCALLYIRGGYPWENSYYLDDVPIFWAYHWGGRLSMFNPRLIKEVNLYTGVAPPKFREVIGGIIDVKYRRGKEIPSVELELSPAVADVLFEGSLFGNFSYLLSFRRTHYDLIMNLLYKDKGYTYPWMNDALLKINLDASSTNKFSLWYLYLDEGMRMELKEGEELGLPGTTTFDYFYKKPILCLGWEYIPSHRIKKKTQLARIIDEGDFDFYNPEILFTQKIKYKQYIFSEDITINLSDRHTLEIGGIYYYVKGEDELVGGWYEVVEENGTLTKKWREITVPGTITITNIKPYSLYIQDNLSIGPITFQTGIRYAQPYRLKLKGKATPQVTINYSPYAATNIKVAFMKKTILPFPTHFDRNPYLSWEYCDDYVLGIENKIGEAWRFRVETYYKKLYNLVLSGPVYSADGGQQPTPWVEKPENKGKGSAKGIEFYLEKAKIAGSRWHGWLSYNLSKSERTERSQLPGLIIDENKLYPTDQDRRHSLSIVLNYQISKRWHLLIKYRFDTGNPYTPIESWRKFELPQGEILYYPNYGEYKSKRMPSYQRMDVKLSYTKRWRKTVLSWYFQILNLYNHKNVYQYYYLEDKKKKEMVRHEMLQFPFMPLVGIELKF